MTNLTQKFSKQFVGAALRVVTLALFLVVFGASAALAQTRGYVTNTVDNTVSVIDTATNMVVATVPVGVGPRGVAINPNGAFAYVANSGDNTVSVISTATNAVVATIPVGNFPIGIAFGVRAQGPTNKDQCKHGGWQTFTDPTFRSQGECIRFVNHLN
jgi:YVTN family beta-propeller protein